MIARLHFPLALSLVFVLFTTVTAQDLSLHATGCRPPTAAESAWMQQHLLSARQVHLNTLGLSRVNAGRRSRNMVPLSGALTVPVGREIDGRDIGSAAATGILPEAVDNSTLPYFPPIANQGGQNSCAAFACTYYQMTYMTALARGWSVNNADDTRHFSPRWSYNLVNGGKDEGTWITNIYSIEQQHGAATLAELPYDGNYLAWCTDPGVWRHAIDMRMDRQGTVTGLDTDTGLQQLKTLLTDGYVLNFGTNIYAWQFVTVKDDPATHADDAAIGQAACAMLGDGGGGHAMTIVGYNDAVWVDINGNGVVDPGEKGALCIANSWGSGWGNGGFIWLAYDALKTVSAVLTTANPGRQVALWSATAYWLTARPAYSPAVVAQFNLNTVARNQCAISLGVSTPDSAVPLTTWTAPALNMAGGAYAFDGSTTACDAGFVLDYTDLLPGYCALRWYLGVTGNTSAPVTVKAFKIIDVAHGNIEQAASGLPQTVTGTNVYFPLDYPYAVLGQQPDLQIDQFGAPYAGVSICNATGQSQSQLQTLANHAVGVYHLRLANAGELPDQFTMTAAGGTGEWIARYFDAHDAGMEITAQVTGSGWTSPVLHHGETCDLRLEVTANSPVSSGISLLVTAHSTLDPTRGDTVQALARYQLTYFGSLIRASVTADGAQANASSSAPATLSRDGRYLAFASFASNLVPSDTNGMADIFVRDNQSGQLTRVSVASDGTEADMRSAAPSISADGRYVAFMSFADNLVPDDTNGFADVFVHDCVTGATQRVSVAADGTQGDKLSTNPMISADGGTVAFVSSATTLVPGDTNNCFDVFVSDWQTGVIERVSVSDAGVQGNANSGIGGRGLAISGDGQQIAFTSYATTLTKGNSTGNGNVYVHDRRNGTTRCITVAVDGSPANGDSACYDLSANGRYLLFSSTATNLIADHNWSPPASIAQLYVADLQTGTIEPVSVSESGAPQNMNSNGASISADGRFVVFSSDADNLVWGDSNQTTDVFLRDRVAGATLLLSTTAAGQQGDRSSVSPIISKDGRCVVFSSAATNLVPDDTNNTNDLFLFTSAFPQPDLLISAVPDSGYLGAHIYQDIEAQTLAQQTIVNHPAVCYVRVTNEGWNTDTIQLTGTPAGDGWTVRYFDALSGGNEITDALLHGGWCTPTLTAGNGCVLRCEATPAAGTPRNSAQALLLTATSLGNATFCDAVGVRLTRGNAAPCAVDGALAALPETPATGQFVATDADGDPLTFRIIAQGRQGIAVVTDAAAGAFRYTPNAGASGSDTVTFAANDGQVDSNSATVIVTIGAAGWEGDVSAHPGGDGAVTIADWVQEGRFIARLDTPATPDEFQRADCAPRATLGDGRITLADWVQVGRYAVGLDPLTAAGGPTQPAGTPAAVRGAGGTPRMVQLSTAMLVPGTQASVQVILTALGNENALAFSLNYDPARVRILSVQPLGIAAKGAILVNAHRPGVLAVALALPPGTHLPCGMPTVCRLLLQALPTAKPGTSPLTFSDGVACRELTDIRANRLPVIFRHGLVRIIGLPRK